MGSKTNAIVVVVPYKLLKAYHKIQQRLVRELEKKFRCVCYVPPDALGGRLYNKKLLNG